MTITEITELVNNEINPAIRTIEKYSIDHDSNELHESITQLSEGITEIVKLTVKLTLRLQHSEKERFYDSKDLF